MEQADSPNIAFDPSGSVYMSFSEHGQYGQADVMKFDGTNWNFVASRGFSSGSGAYNNMQLS